MLRVQLGVPCCWDKWHMVPALSLCGSVSRNYVLEEADICCYAVYFQKVAESSLAPCPHLWPEVACRSGKDPGSVPVPGQCCAQERTVLCSSLFPCEHLVCSQAMGRGGSARKQSPPTPTHPHLPPLLPFLIFRCYLRCPPARTFLHSLAHSLSHRWF